MVINTVCIGVHFMYSTFLGDGNKAISTKLTFKNFILRHPSSFGVGTYVDLSTYNGWMVDQPLHPFSEGMLTHP